MIESTPGTLLTIKDLNVTYENKKDPAVSNFSLELVQGETLGLFGKSGCGKSTVAWTVMGLIDRMGGHAEGNIRFDGITLLDTTKNSGENQVARININRNQDGWNENGGKLNDRKENNRKENNRKQNEQKKNGQKLNGWKQVGWKQISIVPQSSMSTLNPVYTVQKTLEETLAYHVPSMTRAERGERCLQLMEMVFLPDRVLRSYPHELSGGMRQRVFIALAVMLKPRLLLLDEATTGLDVVVEAEILHTLRHIKRDENLSMLLISHDARIQEAFCDRRIDM